MPGVGNAEAAPDSVWHLDRDMFFGWEAKSDEKPDAPIAVKRVRQAKGHIDWITDHFKLTDSSRVSAVMTSPRTTLDTEARKFAESVWYMNVEGARELATVASRALANVRRDAGNASETAMAEA